MKDDINNFSPGFIFKGTETGKTTHVYLYHEIYTDENGNEIVKTASGATAKANYTVAADTSVLPFGTKIKIDGVEYEVQDRGGAIKGNRIDIYFGNDHNGALKFGKKKAEVFKICN